MNFPKATWVKTQFKFKKRKESKSHASDTGKLNGKRIEENRSKKKRKREDRKIKEIWRKAST